MMDNVSDTTQFILLCFAYIGAATTAFGIGWVVTGIWCRVFPQ